jgi:type VI secretion system protein ImpM
MSLGFRLAQTVAPQYAVFGKLPKCADFVRVNGAHPVVIEFDRLIADSLEWARRQPTWSEASYLAADPCDFHFVSRDGRWALLGVMHPSKDAAGRLYPLVAGIVLPVVGVVSHAFLFPIVGELFFSALREQLRKAVESSSQLLACRQFLELQLKHHERLDADVELAAAVLERHLEQTPAANLHVCAFASAG